MLVVFRSIEFKTTRSWRGKAGNAMADKCTAERFLRLFCKYIALILLLGQIKYVESHTDYVRHAKELQPTVTVAILVRNKAHVLPYFLQAVENLSYPKDRISIWYVCFF